MREPFCFYCKHYKGLINREALIYGCQAFPEGIPASILEAKEQHRDMKPDQKGEFIFNPVSPEYKGADELPPPPPAGTIIN